MGSFFKKIKTWGTSHRNLTILLFSILLSILTITFSCGLNFFIYPSFRLYAFDNDPQFFYLAASMMLKGKTMYIDIFDHKGLYIFWYHALGQLMGGRVGLYILQIIYFIPFFYFLGLSFKEIKDDLLFDFLFMFTAGAIYVCNGQSGSSAEPELPFIAMASYFYLRGYRRHSQNSFMVGNIIWGIQAGICINGRPSDCMFALGPILAYAVMMFRKRKFLIILRDAGLCLGALILTCLPAYIAALSGSYLQEMFEMVILANFTYVATYTAFTVEKLILVILMVTMFVVTIPCLVYLYKRIDRDEWIYYAVCFAFVWPLQLILVRAAHYLIPAIPYLLIYVACLLNEMKPGLAKERLSKAMSALSILAFAAMAIIYPTEYYAVHYNEEKASTSYIKEAISENERELYTFGITEGSGVYSECGIVPQYRDFTMQIWHSTMDHTMFTRIKEFITQGYVHYLLVDQNYDFNADLLDLNSGKDFAFLDDGGQCPLYRIYTYKGIWLYYADE